MLLPIFAFMTVENINRQRENTTRLLLEKGAALIRSFEAGTRSGMMGGSRRGFRLQVLLTETAQQPDIVYLFVVDENGTILAHSDLSQIGKKYGNELDPEKISSAEKEMWRIKTGCDSKKIFEVFSSFSPMAMPMEKQHWRMMFDYEEAQQANRAQSSSLLPKVIFIGLDMEAIEAAQKVDTRHTVIMGIILLLIGFAGIILLFVSQSYRTTKATLSRVKAFSDNLVENVPIGLIAIDDNQKIASFNNVAKAVLGISIENAMGKEAEKILPKDLMEKIDNLNAKNVAIEEEIDCLVQAGKCIPLLVSASFLYDENRTFLGSILLFKDLSEVQALRREIARNQRLASIGRLAAGVAHEIRNPLSSIKGFAAYFRERYRDNKDDQQTADIMIQEVERLNRVVGQLLEFARPITISKKAAPVDTVIKDSLRLIRGQAAEKYIKIETDFSSIVKNIQVDTDRINQVLLNLYLNAIESMQDGGSLNVALSTDEKKKWLIIKVADNGTGIRKEDIAHIFDPYFTTKPSGTGLGLAIVHNIIDAHDGKMEVESSPGKGTTITLFLPIL